MERVQTPSPEHEQFDDMCAEVDDFQPLPAVKPKSLEREQNDEDDTSLDGQILAGLVTPV